MDPQARIVKVLQSVTGKDIHPGEDEAIFTSGLLDSFALTDFVAGIEEEFGITVPDADLSARKFDTIEKIESYISSQQSK
jgi:acyl carrier protein